MVGAPMNDQSIATAILRALHSEIERAAEEELEAAKLRLEKRIRAQIGAIATTIASEYDITTGGSCIVIKVRDLRQN